MMEGHPRVAERAREPRYTFPEAAAFIKRPTSTVRRWSVGNVRHRGGLARLDEPLIRIDGDAALPLSFLNLLELRFLAAYRRQVPLQSIRRALDFAAVQLGEQRPLLALEFKARGRSLFLEFFEGHPDSFLINASHQGQLAWPQALDSFIESVDYDDAERNAYRWWPLGREKPVIIDTLYNGGLPSTALSGVRTNAIAMHRREGFDVAGIADDVGAAEDEVRAALLFEQIAA